MTTKKILVIVVSIVVVLGFDRRDLCWWNYRHGVLRNRQQRRRQVSKDFLRNNERLKQDIGEVKDFGSFVTGNININNGDGTAELNLKVIGERKEVNASWNWYIAADISGA